MNLPIEMICVCGADGAMEPLRFRMENEEKCLQTVSVSQVLCSQSIQYAGVDAVQYLCKAVCDEKEHMFELRYTLKTHTWTLFRVVY